MAGWLAGHRFGPLCGLVASGHSEFACRWHVHSTADTWNKISASSVLVGARTHIELTWPNGPMVAVGHVHHNNKSIHRLNHSGGDNHPERAARCGSHASLIERHLCWHSDPSLDRERHKGARCHSHLRPHGEAEDGRFASCDVSALLPRPEMVENRHRHVNIIRIVTP